MAVPSTPTVGAPAATAALWGLAVQPVGQAAHKGRRPPGPAGCRSARRPPPRSCWGAAPDHGHGGRLGKGRTPSPGARRARAARPKGGPAGRGNPPRPGRAPGCPCARQRASRGSNRWGVRVSQRRSWAGVSRPDMSSLPTASYSSPGLPYRASTCPQWAAPAPSTAENQSHSSCRRSVTESPPENATEVRCPPRWRSGFPPCR